MAVVTNPTVAEHYLEPALVSLRRAGFDPATIRIPDGEEHKNFASLTRIYDQMLEAGIERSGAVVALGGGVVGDLTGFAAATYLRGVACVQVPTTLLAQVDSSIGGKTGVNHVLGKNLIGAFSQPRFVLADVETLRTLPPRELTAGLAEVIKYGIILDAPLFTLLEERIADVQALDRDLLVEVVRRCCAIKASVVSADETESGLRAVLNFGHTVGHGIESITGYTRYLHGEAVAIGMVAAARVSRHLGFCAEHDVERIRSLLVRCGLPTEVPAELRGEALARAMRADKKAREGAIKFVCLETIGTTRFERLSPEDIVKYL
jgi:3-dehydroquinate synthase